MSLSTIARRAAVYAQSLVNQGLGPGTSAPVAKNATVPSSTGTIYTIARLLGSTSTLSLLSGSNSNLNLNAATGAISATTAIAAGVSQLAIVREAAGQLAVEYPLTITGQSVAAPTPTPTPTPTPAPTPTPTPTPSTRYLVATNRFRTNRDFSLTAVAAGSAYGYDRTRFRTGNSTTNLTFILHNGIYEPQGLKTNPAEITLRQILFRKVSGGAPIRGVIAGTPVTTASTAALPGGVVGGALVPMTPETPLDPNSNYYVETWDNAPIGSFRPYPRQTNGNSGPAGSAAYLSDEASKNASAPFDGAAVPANGSGTFFITSSYIIGAFAQGITGPSVVTFADSIEDQEWVVPGSDIDSGAWIRPSLSNPATTFIPNQGTVRYSGHALSALTDNYAGSGDQQFMSLWTRIAAMLGQTDWPFNAVVYEHWRNQAGGSTDMSNATSAGGVSRAFFDYLLARTPSLKIFATTPIPVLSATVDSKGYTDESVMQPYIQGANNVSTDVRNAYIAWLKAGADGRIAGVLDMANFVKGLTADWKWPATGVFYALKAAVVSGANTTSFKLSAAPPLGGLLVFNPGSTTVGSEMAFAVNVMSVTDNGDGTFQVVTRGGMNKAYPVDTIVGLANTADGTHESRYYSSLMQAKFEASYKPAILAKVY